jgi:hypothetical protein
MIAMLSRISFILTIMSTVNNRFLQEEDETSCLDKKLFFFADGLCQ